MICFKFFFGFSPRNEAIVQKSFPVCFEKVLKVSVIIFFNYIKYFSSKYPMVRVVYTGANLVLIAVPFSCLKYVSLKQKYYFQVLV